MDKLVVHEAITKFNEINGSWAWATVDGEFPDIVWLNHKYTNDTADLGEAWEKTCPFSNYTYDSANGYVTFHN